MDTHGLSPFYVLSILNAASIFGRGLPNYFSDIIGPLNVQFPAIVVSSILVFAAFSYL